MPVRGDLDPPQVSGERFHPDLVGLGRLRKGANEVFQVLRGRAVPFERRHRGVQDVPVVVEKLPSQFGHTDRVKVRSLGSLLAS